MNNFMKTVRWSLITNKRYYIKQAITLCLAFFVIMVAYTGLFTGYKRDVLVSDAVSAVPLVATVYILASGIIASAVMFDLKTKQQRSLYMMLPASNRDKFWSRILLAVILGFVVSALAICVADVLQMLLSWIFTGTHASVVSAMWSSPEMLCFSCATNCSETSTMDVLVVLMVLASAAWGFSSYILGGFFFRKIPFILTSIAWILFWTVICVGGAALFMKFLDGYDNIYIEFWWDKDITLGVISVIVCLLFTAVNLWLSYRIHNRLTVNCQGLLNI